MTLNPVSIDSLHALRWKAAVHRQSIMQMTYKAHYKAWLWQKVTQQQGNVAHSSYTITQLSSPIR